MSKIIFPRQSSLRYKLLKAFIYSPPMSPTELTKRSNDLLGYTRMANLLEDLNKLVNDHCLAWDGKRYSATRHAIRFFNECEPTQKVDSAIVSPPYKKTDKPWSGKFNISAQANRPDAGAPEERPHFSGAARVAPRLRGV